MLVSDIVAAYQHPDVENAMATEDCFSEQHRVANMLWYERAGLDRDLAEAAYATEFDPETHPLYPDSRGILSQLHASGVRVAVVSNFRRDIRLALADHGLAEFADAVVTSSEHGFRKPDPRMFSVALGLLDVDAADVLMAGDSAPNDGAAAAIGIDTLILPMPAEADVSHRGLDVVVRLVGPTSLAFTSTKTRNGIQSHTVEHVFGTMEDMTPESPSTEQVLSHPHKLDRGQSWEDVDEDIRDYVISTVDSIAEALEPVGFIGAYLHGSLTMGSYYRGKSDVDLYFVVERRLTTQQRCAVTHKFADLSDQRPTVGDVEASVLLKSDTLSSRQPMPYEAHYSEALRPAIRASAFDFSIDRRDPDSAAHISGLLAVGVVVAGDPISEVFGEVPVEDLRSAARSDLEWILEDEHILSTPFYGVLNCCRWLLSEAEGWGRPVDKNQAGGWGLTHLPEANHAIIAQALACYRSSEPVDPDERRTDGHGWNEEQLLTFRDYIQSTLTDEYKH